jgi:hypothetical protein
MTLRPPPSSFRCVLYFRGDTHPRDDVPAAGHGQRLARELVTRVGHHHGEVAIGFGHRQYQVLLEESQGDVGQFRSLVGQVGRAHQRQVEQPGLRLGNVPLGDQAEADQQRDQVAAVLLLVGLRAPEIGALQPAVFEQVGAHGVVDVRFRRSPGQFQFDQFFASLHVTFLCPGSPDSTAVGGLYWEP